MAQRIKGQEVEVTVMQNGNVLQSLQHCKTINFTFNTRILEEEYLGQTSKAFDSVFDGVSGDAEFHFQDAAPFALTVGILDKAQRRQPGTVYNIKATFNFPSGRRARVIIRNVEFGPLPFETSSRSDFVNFKMSFASTGAQVLPL